MGRDWKVSTQCVRETMKQISIKKLQVSVVMRVNKIFQARLKIKIKHIMVMFICMNVVNTSAIQGMNARSNKQLYPSVIQKSLWKSTNMTMKTFDIVLWLINNWKGFLRIRKSSLQIFKTLQTFCSILPSIVLV